MSHARDHARPANQEYPGFGDRSLLSGFQCFFDSALLTRGESRFDFDITVNGAPTRVTRIISPSPAGAVKISDVFIDIVGPCNLKCAMCPQGELKGTRGNRGRGFMSIELFDRVLSRLQAAGYVGKSINLYNWGDPLLHPALGHILDICEQNQYRAIVSTNLSFPEARVQALTEHPVELLLVSVSGFSAEEAGFEFGAYLGAIPSAESFFRYQSERAYRQAADLYIIPESLAVRSARFCPQQATITINHRAELDRCCVSWGSEAPVSVFDADLQKHLEQKTASAFCRRCLSSGYSYYKHFGIFRPDLLQP